MPDPRILKNYGLANTSGDFQYFCRFPAVLASITGEALDTVTGTNEEKSWVKNVFILYRKYPF